MKSRNLDASVKASYDEWSRLFEAAKVLNSLARYHVANENGTYVNHRNRMDDKTLAEARGVIARLWELEVEIWKLDSQFAEKVDMGLDMVLKCSDIVHLLSELEVK